MMMEKHQLLSADFNDIWFDSVFKAVDRLHDEVSAGHLRGTSPLPSAMMISWLEDIIYTAQEAILEIRANDSPMTEADPIPAQTGHRLGSEG